MSALECVALSLGRWLLACRLVFHAVNCARVAFCVKVIVKTRAYTSNRQRTRMRDVCVCECQWLRFAFLPSVTWGHSRMCTYLEKVSLPHISPTFGCYAAQSIEGGCGTPLSRSFASSLGQRFVRRPYSASWQPAA